MALTQAVVGARPRVRKAGAVGVSHKREIDSSQRAKKPTMTPKARRIRVRTGEPGSYK